MNMIIWMNLPMNLYLLCTNRQRYVILKVFCFSHLYKTLGIVAAVIAMISCQYSSRTVSEQQITIRTSILIKEHCYRCETNLFFCDWNASFLLAKSKNVRAHECDMLFTQTWKRDKLLAVDSQTNNKGSVRFFT